MILTKLGPLGNLREFISPPPHPVAAKRASRSLVTIGGVAKLQRAPRLSRQLTWTLPMTSPDDIRELIALELGVYGPGPYWYYDALAARLQMLPPGVASPGLGGDQLFDDFGTATLDYATAAPWKIGVTGSGEAETPVVPAVVGTTYIGAAEVSADARIGLRWVDSSGSTLSTDYGTTGTTRRSASAQAPASTAGVKVVLDPTSSASEVEFSEIQLVEGSAVIDWEPGPGMARWSFTGGVPTAYQHGSGEVAEFRRDVTVTLVEVS